MLTFDEKQMMLVFDRGLYICSCSEVPPHSGNRLALKAAVFYATDTQDRQHPINVSWFGEAHADRQNGEARARDAATKLAKAVGRKNEYKKMYSAEYTEHAQAREEILRLNSRARDNPSDPDSSDFEDLGPDGPPRPPRGPLRRQTSDRLGREATPPVRHTTPDFASAPRDSQRRAKQPEPASFSGPGGTKSGQYQKWKLDVMA
jgi:hypothetical protein